MFKTRKNLRIAIENNKVLYEQLEEKRKLDVERQKQIVKLRNQISKNEHQIELLKTTIRELEEINRMLGNGSEKLALDLESKTKECANLKRLCTKNGVEYKKKGEK